MMQQKPIILNKKDYVVIQQAVSTEVCDLLADYANFKAAIKPNIKKDGLKNVHREYGDPLMELLLGKLTPLIEEATGLALWPTLAFYYTYKNGNELTKHKDRSSCQIVAGLCIGADEAFKKEHGTWPLILDVEGKSESIALGYGDILVFKGHETVHWREVFKGAWFVSAIFAYVDKNGPFAFQKFDQRQSLGKPHVGMFHWLYGSFKGLLKQRFYNKRKKAAYDEIGHL